MQQILRCLPKKRQSMLFSATQTPKVDELVKVALHANPLKIDANDKKDEDAATVEGLEQVTKEPSSNRSILLLRDTWSVHPKSASSYCSPS